MRVPRAFVDLPLNVGESVTLPAAACRHLAQVLRMRSGQTVTLFNGDGRDYAAELVECRRDHCVALVQAVISIEDKPRLILELGIGISRGERMDLAIQKAVELGIHEITPLKAARTVVRLDSAREEGRLSHWRQVVTSACEQAGRNRLPVLRSPMTTAEWLQGRRTGLVLDHRAEKTLTDLAEPSSPLSLLIGPEGGLDGNERAAALQAGFTAVRLGPRILRTETAPLAALAAIQTLWGDFR